MTLDSESDFDQDQFKHLFQSITTESTIEANLMAFQFIRLNWNTLTLKSRFVLYLKLINSKNS